MSQLEIKSYVEKGLIQIVLSLFGSPQDITVQNSKVEQVAFLLISTFALTNIMSAVEMQLSLPRSFS